MGTYHTHPIDRHAEFSMLDKSFYTYQDKRPGYLAGTNDQGIGEILQFTPGDSVYQGITQTIGTISGGRFIPNPKFNPDKKPRIPPPEGDSHDPNKPNPENE